MEKFVVEGGKRLEGEVEISGSKNASLPILIATLLAAEGKSVIRNVPSLRDINTLVKLLRLLGMEVERDGGAVEVSTLDPTKTTASYELVSTMRASVACLGPLLAMRGEAKVALPGGCVIGSRPIDLHLKGLRQLGAEIEVTGGYVEAKAAKLKGTEIYLGGAYGSTVLGTANVMAAATLAEGTTVIEHAACEPEIVDLAGFLTAMGAKIEGVGTPQLTITGVDSLKGAEYSVIPDRIEAGTFLVAGALSEGVVTVKGARRAHLMAVIDKLTEVGARVEGDGGALTVYPPEKPDAAGVVTLPYPGFPTDMQAQFMVLLSLAEGQSVVIEKVYPDRFMHAGELNRMGANIMREGSSAIIKGVGAFTGAQVMASDLRASVALVLAASIARGNSEISRIYHIDRGYDKVEEKMAALGAKIIRVEDR